MMWIKIKVVTTKAGSKQDAPPCSHSGPHMCGAVRMQITKDQARCSPLLPLRPTHVWSRPDAVHEGLSKMLLSAPSPAYTPC
jgi:hypothetical protein